MRVLLVFLIVCMLGMTVAFPHINQQNPRNRPERPSRFEGPQSRQYFQVSRKIQALEARLSMVQDTESIDGLQKEIDVLKNHKTLIESRLEEAGVNIPQGKPEHPAKRDLKAQMTKRISELDTILANNPNMPQDQRATLTNERSTVHQRIQSMFGDAESNGQAPGSNNNNNPLGIPRP